MLDMIEGKVRQGVLTRLHDLPPINLHTCCSSIHHHQSYNAIEHLYVSRTFVSQMEPGCAVPSEPAQPEFQGKAEAQNAPAEEFRTHSHAS